MKKYYLGYYGACIVEAESEENAARLFWEGFLNPRPSMATTEWDYNSEVYFEKVEEEK